MKEMLKNAGIVLFVCVLFVAGIISFTPYPVSYLTRDLFSNGGPAKKPKNYPEVLEKIVIKKDEIYPSVNKSNTYDLVLPADLAENELVPVIIWVHGGAFVGGQKEDLSIYANMISAQGYGVVNMEYALAPEAKYPSPLVQLTELYQQLTKIAVENHLDMERVIFAGDSAGAHIITQFVALQVNSNFQKELNLPKIVPIETIKGMLLYCGPYSVEGFSESQSNGLINYLVNRIGWAYLGEKNWQYSDKAQEIEINRHVNEKFPPTFITDGNTASFEEQGKQLAETLASKKVMVETAFYPVSTGKIMHEYQFDMTLPQSQKTFERTIAFLCKIN